VLQGQESAKKLPIENDNILGEFFFLLPFKKLFQIEKKIILIPTQNFIFSGHIADSMRHFLKLRNTKEMKLKIFS